MTKTLKKKKMLISKMSQKNIFGGSYFSNLVKILKNLFQDIIDEEEEQHLIQRVNERQTILSRKKNIKMMRKRLIDIEKELKDFVYLDSELPLGKRIYKGIIDLCEKYPKLLITISILTPIMIYNISKVLLGSKVKKIKNKNMKKISLFKSYFKLFKE